MFSCLVFISHPPIYFWFFRWLVSSDQHRPTAKMREYEIHRIYVNVYIFVIKFKMTMKCPISQIDLEKIIKVNDLMNLCCCGAVVVLLSNCHAHSSVFPSPVSTQYILNSQFVKCVCTAFGARQAPR